MIKTAKIHSPWVVYFQKLKAFFARDPEVKIVFDEQNYMVYIYVDNTDKAEALKEIMRSQVQFGNITLTINVVPPTYDPDDILGLYERAFKRNGAFRRTRTISTPDGNEHDYVIFNPEVVQYDSDNLADANGVSSTLYQDIAKDIMIDQVPGVFFCTDIARGTFHYSQPVRLEED